MSTAPLPHKQSSAISPENGSWVVTGFCRHDVEVSVDQQTGPRPVLTFPAHHETGPTLGRLEHLGLQPHLGELAGDVLCRLPLPRATPVAIVGRVDADQVAGEFDDIVRSVDLGLGHAASWCSQAVPDAGSAYGGGGHHPAPAGLVEA